MATCKCCGQTLPQPSREPRKSLSALMSAMPRTFDEGMERGKNWDANWYPGGPFNEDERRVWLEGFSRGLNWRLSNDTRFRKWWDNQRHTGRHLRYAEPESRSTKHT